MNWLEELNARGELIHFKGVDANVLEGLKAVGELTYSLKGVFLEAEGTVLVCAFEMQLSHCVAIPLWFHSPCILEVLYA